MKPLEKNTENLAQRNCWICEGWMQHKFKVSPSEKDARILNVYLHLNIDDFLPTVMTRKEGSWVLNRMLPTFKDITHSECTKHELNYFFSI
jgi:hypothetical protein